MDSASVLTFFSLKGSGKYLCLLPSCPRNTKALATSKTNKTGSLRDHLRNCHADVFATSIAEKKKADQAVRKLKIIQYCVEAVTVNGRPLALLDDSGSAGLIALATESHKIAINSSNVRQHIRAMASRIREKITIELKDRIISVMSDIVTKHHRGILGINIQYYSEGKIELRTVGVIEMHERHSGKTIKNMILANLRSYGVSPEQIYAYTTDSASNMIKSASLINLDAIDDVASNDGDGGSYMNPGEEYIVTLPQITGIRCAAHSLQTAVRDGLTASDAGVFIAKCREIAKTLRTQVYLLEFRNQGAKLPLMDNDTRWNSTYLMLKRLLEIKEIIVGLAKNDENLFLSDNEWKQLEKLVNVLRHPYQVTMLLQRVNLTQSDFYAAWLELKLVLQGIHENDVDETLAQSILNAMDSAKHDHLIRNASMQCSVFLDPRVKNILLQDREQSDATKKYLLELYERLIRLKNNRSQQSSERNEHDNDNSGDEISTYSNLTRFMRALDDSISHDASIDSTKNNKSDISQLLDDFAKMKSVAMNIPIFEYWEENKQNFPELYELAKIVHAAPVTETSVERTFSTLRFVFSALRGNLAEELLEDMMLIKLNKDLFDEVVSEELEEATFTA